jgi:hypothetical protein
MLAQRQLLQMQLDLSHRSGLLGGRVARLTGGNSTVTVLAALAVALLVWIVFVLSVSYAAMLRQ